MEPFELIEEHEKQAFCKFTMNYGNGCPIDIKQTLSTWNDNKKELFKAMGGELRKTFSIDVKTEKVNIITKLNNVYEPLCIEQYDTIKKKDFGNQFINSVRNYIYDVSNVWQKFKEHDYEHLRKLFDYKYVYDGCLDFKYTFFFMENKSPLKICPGMKTMRAIRKILDYIGYDTIELFNEWRDSVSLVKTTKRIKANLVVSIHPLDFITMSDNNSGWSSCVSFKEYGSYRNGCIEMMNSKYAFLVFLENSNKHFLVDNIIVPNKSWRSLGFIHDDFLVIGKGYPYTATVLSEQCLDICKDLFESNTNHKWEEKRKTLPKDMEIYFENMYNDFIEDKSYNYYCYTNDYKKNHVYNLSGPITCITCGKEIVSYVISGAQTNCTYCEENRYCEVCGRMTVNEPMYRISLVSRNDNLISVDRENVCKECLTKDYWYDKIRNAFVYKIDFPIIKRESVVCCTWELYPVDDDVLRYSYENSSSILLG